MIEDFLTHHKRLCPSNRGRSCTCGLFKAREELRRRNKVEEFTLTTLQEVEKLLDGPIADLLTGDSMNDTGSYDVLELVRAAITQMDVVRKNS